MSARVRHRPSAPDPVRHRPAEGPPVPASSDGLHWAAGHAGTAYHTPRLTAIMAVDELLETLGPAQANYGGTGFP
jgi:hypothetical protein